MSPAVSPFDVAYSVTITPVPLPPYTTKAIGTLFRRLADKEALLDDIAGKQPHANQWLPVDLAASYLASGIFEISPGGFLNRSIIQLKTSWKFLMPSYWIWL